MEAATALGEAIAQRKIGVVYGGGSLGLMGAVSSAARMGGSEVLGITTENFAVRETIPDTDPLLYVAETMHERKTWMSKMSDAFIALPGGIGTLEEIIEMWTWAQTGESAKRVCAFYNVNGFYDKLIEYADHVIDQGFMEAKHKDLIIVSNDPEELLDQVTAFVQEHKSWAYPESGILKNLI
jgi:uncharacterized protein (TIGR00730 family)